MNILAEILSMRTSVCPRCLIFISVNISFFVAYLTNPVLRSMYNINLLCSPCSISLANLLFVCLKKLNK